MAKNPKTGGSTSSTRRAGRKEVSFARGGRNEGEQKREIEQGGLNQSGRKRKLGKGVRRSGREGSVRNGRIMRKGSCITEGEGAMLSQERKSR